MISADDESVVSVSPTALTDKNLFAYCDNNPVIRKDSSGQIWNTVFGALGGGLIEMAMRSEKESIGQAFLRGAATGAIAGLSLDVSIATAGLAPALAIAAGGGAISSITNTYLKNSSAGKSTTCKDIVASAVAGAVVNTAFGAAGCVASRTVGTTVKSVSKAVLANSKRQVTTQSGRFLASRAGRNATHSFVESTGSSFVSWLYGKVLGRLFK